MILGCLHSNFPRIWDFGERPVAPWLRCQRDDEEIS